MTTARRSYNETISVERGQRLEVKNAFHQFLNARELGGAALTALHMARFLTEKGHTTPVWIPGPGPALEEAQRLDLDVVPYEPATVLSPWKLKALLGSWRLGRRLRGHGSGIVHVHNPLFYGALRWGLKYAGLRQVAHVQIEEDPGGLRWAFRHPPHLIITCARFLVDHVRRTLPESRREQQWIAAVPNAVDTERFQPGEKHEAKLRVGAPGDAPLLLMLANLAPHKGQETTIRAVATLKQQGVSVVCWLAGIERGGGKTYTAHLEALISELGVKDRVQLLGFRRDCPELLRAADLFLLPSTLEGLPLSLLEAQATKVPVLAAPVSGVPEVVTDGETGFLVEASDAAGYARRITDLLGNADLYHRLAEQAYRKATQEYNWKILCGRIWQLYQELLEKDL